MEIQCARALCTGPMNIIPETVKLLITKKIKRKNSASFQPSRSAAIALQHTEQVPSITHTSRQDLTTQNERKHWYTTFLPSKLYSNGNAMPAQ